MPTLALEHHSSMKFCRLFLLRLSADLTREVLVGIPMIAFVSSPFYFFLLFLTNYNVTLNAVILHGYDSKNKSLIWYSSECYIIDLQNNTRWVFLFVMYFLFHVGVENPFPRSIFIIKFHFTARSYADIKPLLIQKTVSSFFFLLGLLYVNLK